MNQFEERLEQYKTMATKLNLGISDDLLYRVTKSLGPSIYDLDTEVIACSQKDELEALKKNFIKKQLEVTADDETIDKAIDEVCEEMGRSNSVKFRALFYILLTRKFNKESFYDA
jgi:hypothetical protein